MRSFNFQTAFREKKLFIIVNSPASAKENYLVCKTTSQEKPPHRTRQQGCSAPEKNYFMFLAGEDWFKKDTWIQFDKIYEFKADRLLKDKFDGKIKYQTDLKAVNAKAVLSCILKSEDISKQHLISIQKSLNNLD